MPPPHQPHAITHEQLKSVLKHDILCSLYQPNSLEGGEVSLRASLLYKKRYNRAIEKSAVDKALKPLWLEGLGGSFGKINLMKQAAKEVAQELNLRFIELSYASAQMQKNIDKKNYVWVNVSCEKGTSSLSSSLNQTQLLSQKEIKALGAAGGGMLVLDDFSPFAAKKYNHQIQEIITQKKLGTQSLAHTYMALTPITPQARNFALMSNAEFEAIVSRTQKIMLSSYISSEDLVSDIAEKRRKMQQDLQASGLVKPSSPKFG